jgi:dihydropteroate synthase
MQTITTQDTVTVTFTREQAVLVQAALQRFSALRDEDPAERREAVQMACQLYHDTEGLD